MVRQCFDQIKHLVENCNLEIKIPRFVAPPPPTQSTTDFSPQLVMDTTLVYYMRMNISPFKKGQLDPMECIEKALNRRFSAMDSMLNLNNFQSIEGKCIRSCSVFKFHLRDLHLAHTINFIS